VSLFYQRAWSANHGFVYLQEYFEFDAGAAKSRGLSPETEAKIKQWLKDNPS
jgi:hypothetical protein